MTDSPGGRGGFHPGTSPAERRAFFDELRVRGETSKLIEALTERVEELEGAGGWKPIAGGTQAAGGSNLVLDFDPLTYVQIRGRVIGSVSSATPVLASINGDTSSNAYRYSRWGLDAAGTFTGVSGELNTAIVCGTWGDVAQQVLEFHLSPTDISAQSVLEGTLMRRQNNTGATNHTHVKFFGRKETSAAAERITFFPFGAVTFNLLRWTLDGYRL